ncbi:MAG: GAF domain-containing protein [Armatimonadetes bacterium]|nr:GAF domain-containing protein [Armatimonadota bacterium]
MQDTWHQIRQLRDERLPVSVEALQARVRQLETMLDVCSYLASSLDLHTVLARINEVSRDVLGASEASIMLLDEERKVLSFDVVTGEAGRRLQGLEVGLGEGIAGRVAESGEPRLIRDCAAEPGHARRFDEVSGFTTRSLLCVPLVAQGHVVGVLEALNKKDGGAFEDEDVDVATGLAQVAAASVMNAKLFARLKDAQAEMVLAGKLAALGTIASGIAHELNQPLTGILGFVQLLQRKLDRETLTPENAGESPAFIEKQVHRMSRIIGHIGTFSHPSPAEHGLVSLDLVVADARTLMDEQLRSHGVHLSVALDAALPTVRGDAVRLEEVVINLLANARDAIDRTGRSSGEIRIAGRLKSDEVLPEVSDTGTGIGPEVLPRIFDPFFTTRERGKGTGLGLSITHGIVRDHGGRIVVESTLGEGTRFSVYLPRAAA